MNKEEVVEKKKPSTFPHPGILDCRFSACKEKYAQ